jgi:hypothetical protein
VYLFRIIVLIFTYIYTHFFILVHSITQRVDGQIFLFFYWIVILEDFLLTFIIFIRTTRYHALSITVELWIFVQDDIWVCIQMQCHDDMWFVTTFTGFSTSVPNSSKVLVIVWYNHSLPKIIWN